MLAFRLYHIMCQHGIIYFASQLIAIPFQYDHIILYVLAHPLHLFVLEQRFEFLQYSYSSIPFFRHIYIVAFALLPAKAHTNELSNIRIKSCGLCIECYLFLLQQLIDEFVYLRICLH